MLKEHSIAARTLGLYIQFPFCASKCTFCNFSSRVAPRDIYDRYRALVEMELRSLPEHLARRGIDEALLSLEVDSIYLGGGTPSLLGAQNVRPLARSLLQTFKFAPSVEFTIEITPGSADERLLEELAALGVNRLSIGAQSFSNRELRSVGRLHSAEETGEQVKRARRAGIPQVSLDLIAGLPHQSEDSWRASLDHALEIAPEHLSIYLFEADEKSRLGREVLKGGDRYHAAEVPGDEFMAAAYEEARSRLAGAGYNQYEISNFARPGFESRHNLKYWGLEPYLGLGAGAHSFDGARRWENIEDVEQYEEKFAHGESPITAIREQTEAEQIEEFFFLGLRRSAGVDLREARERWGERSVAAWQSKIDELIREGWLCATGDRVRLDEKSLLVSNEIFQEFVAA